MKPSLLTVIAVALLLPACEKSTPPDPLPPAVRILVVADTQSGDAFRSYSGEVRARYEIPLAFRVGGKLIDRRVDTGAVVKGGQVLARLDATDLRLAAGQAESNRSLAEADVRRVRDLHGKGFISAAALDAKETVLQTAVAQTGLARNQVAYATLAADRAGVIAAVLAEPGQVVSAGQPVLRQALDGEREVAIALPEPVLKGLKIGMPAQVRLWAGNRVYSGRLRELSPVADPATRTFAARVTIVDADAAVALGMTANVRFPTPEPAGLIQVPLAALFQEEKGFAVWAITSDSTVTLKPVTVVGYSDAGALVSSGLAPGERIVAAGVHRLTVGQTVRVAP